MTDENYRQYFETELEKYVQLGEITLQRAETAIENMKPTLTEFEANAFILAIRVGERRLKQTREAESKLAEMGD